MKERSITVRVTEQEYNDLRNKAESLGLDLSRMIRLMAHADIEIFIKLKKEKEE